MTTRWRCTPAHNCSQRGLGGGSFLRKRLSWAASTSSQPRKGLGTLHVPWPSSLPRFLRQESHPRPRHTGPAHLSLTTGPWHCQLSAWNAAPSGWRPPLCSETPPTPPSHHLVYFPQAQKCPCLCLSFRIHFPKQSSATSALVTRKAQLLQALGSFSRRTLVTLRRCPKA